MYKIRDSAVLFTARYAEIGDLILRIGYTYSVVNKAQLFMFINIAQKWRDSWRDPNIRQLTLGLVTSYLESRQNVVIRVAISIADVVRRATPWSWGRKNTTR